jgi:hypothetical protein
VTLLPPVKIDEQIMVLGKVDGEGRFDKLSGQAGVVRAFSTQWEYGRIIATCRVEFYDHTLGIRWLPRHRVVPLHENGIQRRIRRGRQWLRQLSAR